jgi:hypothetical protein
MKKNRQARLMLVDKYNPFISVNISNRKTMFFGRTTYCLNRKLNIGQARWVRYRKWVKSLEEV